MTVSAKLHSRKKNRPSVPRQVRAKAKAKAKARNPKPRTTQPRKARASMGWTWMNEHEGFELIYKAAIDKENRR